MDRHANEYYSVYSEKKSRGHFHRVIPLHEHRSMSWEEASSLAPNLGRGWYELAHLSKQDRIEFTREFWLMKLPYFPHLVEFLTNFFASLDEIGVFLTQRSYADPFKVSLVYSLTDNSGFFHGDSPATESDLIQLQKDFPDFILPVDYLAFLQIHNGFAKLTDTGIFSSHALPEKYAFFQKMIESNKKPVTTTQGDIVNPLSLIPFYQSFDTPFFQCFWKEWYPEQEMGNVYYSGMTSTVSKKLKEQENIETLAFETFIDWLLFYLEKVG